MQQQPTRWVALALVLSGCAPRIQEPAPSAAEVVSDGAAVTRLNDEVARAALSMTGDGAAGLLALLAEREPRFTRLVDNDAAGALALALAPELRDRIVATLPEAAALLEESLAWTGRASVVFVDRLDGREEVRSSVDRDGRPIRIQLAAARGTTWLGVRSGDEVRVEGVLAAGGRTLAARSVEAVRVAGKMALPQEGSCSTTGVQRTAVIVVAPPGQAPAYTNAELQAMFFGPAFPSLDGYLQEASYGLTSAAGAVFGPYTLDRAYDCLEDEALRLKAIELADADVYFPDYQRLFVVFPSPGCYYAGLAMYGCDPTWSSAGDGPFTASRAMLVTDNMILAGGHDAAVKIIAHETGHTLGLGHAQTREHGVETLAARGVSASLNEYGDYYNLMGGGPTVETRREGRFGHFDARHKQQLGWLAAEQVTTVEADGTFLVSPIETLAGAGVRALKIRRPTVNPGLEEWIWVEYRQPIGDYERTLFHEGFDGALVHYATSAGGIWPISSRLLDLTPQSTALDFVDATLAPGSTWVDAYTGLEISVQAAGADLAIDVSYGPDVCTPGEPQLAIAPAAVSTVAGQATSFTVTVTNTDSGACPPLQTLQINTQLPSDWTGGISLPGETGGQTLQLGVAPGQTGTAILTVTPPAGAALGDHPVYVSSQRGAFFTLATATVSVVPGCQSAAECDDGTPCTVDACTAGICGHTSVPDGTSCADPTVCNGAETCVAGACTSGSALQCDDGSSCTADSCDAAVGCVHAPICPSVMASDGFESGTFSGGTGFTSAWTTSGDLDLRTGSGPHTGQRHVRLRSSTGLMTRPLNLAPWTSVSVRVWVKVESFEGNDRAVLQVTGNGTTYTTLRTFAPADSDGAWHVYDLAIPSALWTSQFRVRIDANMSATNDLLHVDDLEILALPR